LTRPGSRAASRRPLSPRWFRTRPECA
jgi:hypothetical protein